MSKKAKNKAAMVL